MLGICEKKENFLKFVSGLEEKLSHVTVTAVKQSVFQSVMM